ncbi:MAG: MFS transporter [Planctomycetota bacterium]
MAKQQMPEAGGRADRASAAARRREGLGFVGFYACSFSVLGVYMQFFPAWLHECRGLTEADIALVIAAQTFARTLAGPFFSQRVDRCLGRARTTLTALAVGAVAAMACLSIVHPLWLLCVAGLAFGAVFPPMLPIVDALLARSAGRSGLSFGRVRMVGSLSFLITIIAAGAWFDAWGTAWVLPALLLVLLATAFATRGLAAEPTVERVRVPDPNDGGAAPSRQRSPVGTLLRSPPFLLLLLSSALIQGSHATYYSLSTVHWNEHGIDKTTASLLWAEGVLAEIFLLFFARQTIDRLRPSTLLLLGALGAAIRWLVLGCSTSVPILFAINWLHAASFAMTYIGAIRMVEGRVPASMRTTAQGLVGAATSGVGMVVCGITGGLAWQHWGGQSYWLMAAFALAGAVPVVWLRRERDARAIES